MIYVTGDTHGKNSFGAFSVDGYMPRLNTRNFPEQKEMTKDDYVLICGDFGGVWETNRFKFEESKDEKDGLDWLESKSFTTLFVPGNHECYDRLTGIKSEELLNSWLYEKMPDNEKEKLKTGYPRKEWHGGYIREIRPSVLMLEAGVFDIDGCKCFAYGGAQSHDISLGILKPYEFKDKESFERYYQTGRFSRVEGVSWWPQEQPSTQIEEQAMAALKNSGMKVDFIFTHSPAMSDQLILGYGDARTKIDAFLEKIKQTVQYRHWFCGHLHMNQDLPGGKEHVLYEQIIRIN